MKKVTEFTVRVQEIRYINANRFAVRAYSPTDATPFKPRAVTGTDEKVLRDSATSIFFEIVPVQAGAPATLHVGEVLVVTLTKGTPLPEWAPEKQLEVAGCNPIPNTAPDPKQAPNT